MLTVKQWEDHNLDLGDEIFEPVFETWTCALSGPFEMLVGFRGTESGLLLHPDFREVLE